MQRRGKKPNSFSVVPTRNNRNIVIEVHDLDECLRPAVQKDIYFAMRRLLRRMHELRDYELQTNGGIPSALHQITTPVQA